MVKNFDHVSHIKSRLTREIENGEFYGLTPTVDNSDEQGSSPIKLNLAKRPTAENLIEGEIAVNYLKGHETLTIKNTEDEIVGFVNENEFNQAQEIVASALAQEKQERISDIASIESQVGNVEGVTDEIQSDIEELEHAVSAALNDLNDRIGAGSSSIAEINDRIDDVIEDVNEQFEQLDLNIEDLELIISSSLNDLNSRLVVMEEGDAEFKQKMNDKELVIASSLNDLNSRILEVNNTMLNFFDSVAYDSENKQIVFSNNGVAIAGLDATAFIKDGMVSNVEVSEGNLVITFNTDAGKEAISIALSDIFDPQEYYNKEEIDDLLDEIELVVSSSLNDLNTRIVSVEENAIQQNLDNEEKFNEIELVVSSSLNDLNSRLEEKDEIIAELRGQISDLTARVEALEA